MNILETIFATIILDSDGERILSRYYEKGWDVNKRMAFEQQIFKKTQRHNNEIAVIDEFIAVHETVAELKIIIVGRDGHNELMLLGALSTFVKSIAILLRDQVDRRTVLENIDYIMLLLDETIDSGVILEVDPEKVVQRVAMQGAESEMSIAEANVVSLAMSFKDTLARSFLA